MTDKDSLYDCDPLGRDEPRTQTGRPGAASVQSPEPDLPLQAAAPLDARAAMNASLERAFEPGPEPGADRLPHARPQGEGLTTRLPAPGPQHAFGSGLPWNSQDFEHLTREAFRLARIGARYTLYAAAAYLGLVLFLILVYRVVDPPGSTLMLVRWVGGASIDHSWVPLGRISPRLISAVVVAEDGRFCEHWGIDLDAIEYAIERAGDGVPRGASTISMQVTKNLFLWPSKSYLRKALEVPLTLLMELVWPKWRILEVYLNVAEWGPGVFGAEAASRHHFAKSAARLGEQEAALLAASLPNPFRRDAGDPGPRTARKARIIQARMHAAGPSVPCVRVGR